VARVTTGFLERKLGTTLRAAGERGPAQNHESIPYCGNKGKRPAMELLDPVAESRMMTKSD
jgi:hypothetical protein